MTYPREVLNRLRWGDGSLSGVQVTYTHRGAPGDVLTIGGEEITELGRSFFSTRNGKIPYHRIVRIEKEGEAVFP